MVDEIRQDAAGEIAFWAKPIMIAQVHHPEFTELLEVLPCTLDVTLTLQFWLLFICHLWI